MVTLRAMSATRARGTLCEATGAGSASSGGDGANGPERGANDGEFTPCGGEPTQ